MTEIITGDNEGKKPKKKSFKDNLKDIHEFRKNQWEWLRTPDDPDANDIIDEGFGGILRQTRRIVVGVEVIVYNSLFKAIYETYIKRKK